MNIHRSNMHYNFDYEISNDNNIFLAGPTLRPKHQNLFTSWRDVAIKIFEKKEFSGELYLPEPFAITYENQVLWEEKRLEASEVILFWVPRELTILPAFTTNVEFGEWMKSGKVVLGYPKDASNMGYLQWKADKYGISVSDTLEGTIELALGMIRKEKK